MVVKAFGVLGKDWGLEEGRRQALPEEHVRIEVNERPVLKAVSNEFAQSPPAGIDVVQPVEFSRDFREVKAELVDEELLSGPIGDQNRIGIMPARGLEGESPSQ
jgi:hypothetical protein